MKSLRSKKMVRKIASIYCLFAIFLTSIQIGPYANFFSYYASSVESQIASEEDLENIKQEIESIESETGSTQIVETSSEESSTQTDEDYVTSDDALNLYENYETQLANDVDLNVELVSYEDPYTKVTTDANGIITMDIYEAPVAYLDENGVYTPFEDKFEEYELIDGSYINNSGNIKYIVNADGSVDVQYQNKTVMTLSSNYSEKLYSATENTVIHSANQASQMTYTHDGALNIVSENNEYDFTYDITLANGYELVQSEGDYYQVVDSNGNSIIRITEFNLADSNVTNKTKQVEEIKTNNYSLNVTGETTQKTRLTYPDFSVINVTEDYDSGFKIHGIHTDMADRDTSEINGEVVVGYDTGVYVPSIRGSGKAIIEFTSGKIFGKTVSEWEEYEVTDAKFTFYVITRNTATNSSSGTVEFRTGIFTKEYTNISSPSNNTYESQKMGDSLIYPDGTTNVKGRVSESDCPPQASLDLTNAANAWTTGAQTRYGMQISGSGDGNMANYHVITSHDVTSYSNLSGCSYNGDNTKPHFTIKYQTKEPVADDLAMSKTTFNLRAFTSTNASTLLNQFQALNVDGQVRPGSDVSYKIVEDKANKTIVSSSSYAASGNKKYPKYHDNSTLNSYPKQIQGYYRLNSNYQEADDILASSSQFKQNTLYQTYYSVDHAATGDKLTQTKGDSFLIYQIKDYETIPRVLAFYGLTTKAEINQFYIDNNSRDLMFVKNNLIFIRNPKQNQNKAYVASSPLSDSDKAIIDHALVGANHACVYGHEPINYNTGNFYFKLTDANLNVGDNQFEIARVYNSMAHSSNMLLGSNWDFSFNSQVVKTDDGSFKIISPTLGTVEFTKSGSSYTSSSGTLTVTDTGKYETYTVDSDYYIVGEDTPITTDIKMPIYNYTYETLGKTVYTYNTYGYLLQIKYPNGQDVVDFTYNINGQITKITLNNDLQISVGYDTLTQNVSRLTFPDNTTITYKYDEYNNLISVKDQNGATQTYEYSIKATEDYQKNLLTSYNSSADGNPVIINEYDKYGRVISQTDENNNKSTFEYLAGETLITNSDGTTQKVEKDPDTMATKSYIDATGNVTNSSYDQDLRLISEENEKGEELTYEYNSKNYIISETNQVTGDVTTYNYDSDDNITSVTNKDGTIYYTYDNNGNLLSETDYESNLTTYTYKNNRKVSESNPDGLVISSKYDSSGNLISSSSDAIGDVTFTYDSMNRQVTRTVKTTVGTDTITQTTNYEYDKRGQQTAIETEMIRYEYIFNDDGLKISETEIDKISNTSKTVEYTYDKLGKVLTTNDGKTITTNTYDIHSNVTKSITTDAQTNDILYETVNTYNEQGRLESKVENGRKTKYYYDENGNQISSTNHLEEVLFTKTYNENNKIVYETDKSGVINTYEYDQNNNLIRKVSNGKETLYEYDEKSQKVKETLEQGSYTTYTYDSLGNVIREVYSNDPNVEGDEVIKEYTYENSKVVSETNGLGNETKRSGDTLLTDKYTTASNNEYDLDYDSAKNISQISIDGIVISKMKYDGRGNLISSIDGNGNETKYQYDEYGRLVKTTYPNGQTEETKYDAKDQVIEAIDNLGNSSVYEYDKYGNVIKVTDSRSNTSTYKYNQLNQMTEETDANGNTTKYEYDDSGNNIIQIDSNGNRISNIYEGESLVYTDKSGIRTVKSEDETELIQTETVHPNDNKTSDNVAYTTVNEYDYSGNLIKSTDKRGNITTYSYNLAKQKTLEIDPFGNQTVIIYDNNGNIISETKNWIASHIEYNDRGLVAAVTDENGNVITFEHDNNGNVIQETSFGITKTFEYDSMGNVTKSCENERCQEDVYNELNQLVATSDSLGNTTYYTYNQFGDRVQTIDPLGYITATEYDNFGREIKVTYPSGDVVETEYNKDGEVTKVSVNGKTKVSYKYNKLSQLVSETDGNGNTKKYYYDGFNNKYKTVNANGRVDIINYNQFGEEIKVTEGNKVVSSRSYDQYGREISVEIAGETADKVYDTNSNVTQLVYNGRGTKKLEYDDSGNLIREEDPNGNVNTFTYDQMYRVQEYNYNGQIETYTYNQYGEVETITSSKGETTSYVYDLNGNKLEVSSSLGTTYYEYDANNNLASITDYDGNITTYEYDSNGNVTLQTNPLGETTGYKYDYENKLLETVEADGTSIVNTYDLNGNLIKTATSVIDSNSQMQVRVQTKQSYDEMNNVTNVNYNNVSSDTYSYDLNGNMIKHVDTAKNETIYTYDDYGRLLKTKSSDTINTFEYDSLNRVKSTTSNGDKTKYEYNNIDQVTKVIDSNGYETKYTYTKAGNIETITYPDKTVAKYKYNKYDELVLLKALDSTINYEYDNFGNVILETNSNGTTTAYEYTKYNLIKTKKTMLDDQVLSKFTYGYDSLLRIDSVIELIEGQKTTKEYEYDQMGRLITSNENDQVSTYEYDALGNITQKVFKSETGKTQKIKYEYNQETNQLLSSDGDTNSVKLEYDKIGNVTTKKYQSGLKETFEYDSNYNLTKVSNNIGVTTTYEYDAFNNRVSKTEVISADANDKFGFLELNDGNNNYSSELRNNDLLTDLSNLSDSLEERTALYDNTCPNLVSDNDNEVTTTTNYVINYNQEYSKNLMTIDEETDLPIDTYVYDQGSNLELSRDDYYNTLRYDTDGRGSVIANTQSSKSDVTEYGYLKQISYDDFGNPSKNITDNYGFNQELHSSSDTQYLRYREYNTQSSRFEEIDSFLGYNTSSQSQNRYAYTENDPVNYIDPSGNILGLLLIPTVRDTAAGAAVGAYNGATSAYSQSRENGDGYLASAWNAVKGGVAGAGAGAQTAYDLSRNGANFNEVIKGSASAGADAGRNVANGKSITESITLGYNSTAEYRAEFARKVEEEKQQAATNEIETLIQDPQNKALYDQILAQHPDMSPAEALELLKHCIALGLDEYTPEAYQAAKEKNKETFATIINVLDFILGIVGLVAGVIFPGLGDAPFDLLSTALMMTIPDIFGAVMSGIALIVPALTSAAAKVMGGIKSIVKKFPFVNPKSIVKGVDSVKGGLFKGLKTLADLPIAKKISKKIDDVISYLDNLIAKLKNSVDNLFKKADDVADDAVDSLAKQTDEIDPNVQVCPINLRSARAGKCPSGVDLNIDNQKVDNLLDGATDTTGGSTKVTNYQKSGGYEKGLTDFESLSLNNITTKPNGTIVGELSDGTRVNFRISPKNGTTIEIVYSEYVRIKIRYD